jgi:transcriptional regulator with XRE-family HTH domain
VARGPFYKELGKYFRGLRDAKGWGLNEAASLAARRGYASLSASHLSDLENDKIKHPSRDALRQLAALYGAPHEQIVWRVACEVYEVAGGAEQPPRLVPTASPIQLSPLEQRALRLFRRIDEKKQAEGVRSLSLVADAYPRRQEPRSDEQLAHSGSGKGRKGHGTR